MSPRGGFLAALAVAMLAATVPAYVAAQSHEHGSDGGPLTIAHDVPPDGRALVGSVSHFGWLLLTEDGKMPSRHQNAEFIVRQNGVTLFATTPASGHDYDALGELDIAFPVAGPYEVVAKVGGHETVFTGTAVVPPDTVGADVVLDMPTAFEAGRPASFGISVLDQETEGLLVHTDATVLVRRATADDTGVVFRTHLHTHDAPMAFDYAFPEPGPYRVIVIAYQAYPSEKAWAFDPVIRAFDVDVAPAPPAGAAPSAPSDADQPNGRDVNDDDPSFTLFGTYDPDPLVGPSGTITMNVVAFDKEAAAAIQHVDFTATLKDPLGRTVFASKTLHEYDGILTVETAHAMPGQWLLEVEALRGDKMAHMHLTFTVVPPVEPLAAGPQTIRVDGLDGVKSGEPTEIVLSTSSAGVAPAMHSEVGVVLKRVDDPTADGNQRLLLMTKLHTHGDALFPFTFTFPEAGKYRLYLDYQEAHKTPTAVYWGEAPLTAPVIEFDVAAGTPLPVGSIEDLLPASEDVVDPQETPGAGVVMVLGTLAAIGAFVGRRRGPRQQ